MATLRLAGEVLGSVDLSPPESGGFNSVVLPGANGTLALASASEFSAYKSSATNNVTGNGTLYTVINDTELFDIGSHYNNSTGIYTAPSTAKHFFSFGLAFTGLTALHTKIEVFLTTTARQYTVFQGNVGALRDAGNMWAASFSVGEVDMSAGDTANVQVKISNGGSDDADLYGQAGTVLYTFFTGRLL